MNRFLRAVPIVPLVAALLVTADPQPTLAQSGDALRVDLNIPALRVDVYEGDQVLRSYPVAVGMRGHDTPTGEFTIDHAEWNPWWRPPAREWAKDAKNTPPGPKNPMGRVKLFFEPLYFIHGTPEAESIGSAASHGCVRMRNTDVIALARLIHEHSSDVSDKSIDGILAKRTVTRHVKFREPIPFRVRYEPVTVEDGELRVYPDVYGYGAIHSEAVYQALLGAGYDLRSVDRATVRTVLERASKQKGVFKVKLGEAFGQSLAQRS